MLCTCHVGPRGREDTVGCRVHHLMPDGCVAADHEVLCACGNFRCDDHDCTSMERTDEDGYDITLVCAECVGDMESCGYVNAVAP
jgi:hypothetical protein